ncbi:MAG: TIR domain-containing protein, partial [Marinicaulis sp.]|nr:TIR domain-containing protein [Marinicaulis sp.]
MADIFISYARADRDRIEKLASALEGEGYSVWWDRRIQSGSEFSKDIEAELNAAKAVVVCWSKSANDSRWVKDEANAGAEAGKLMTVTIDGSLPPIGFRQFHCADLSKWHGKTEEAAFADFNSAVNARVTGEPATISAFPSKPGGAHALSGVHPSIPIVAIVAAAIVAIVWFGVSSETGKEAVQHALEEQTGLTAPPRIAVTPIKVAGDVAALSGMAETLREDIASGLSRFSLIDVAALAQSDVASYQLDATLRQTGDDLRLTARLIDIDSGRQVWGETFDRNIAGKSAFEIQDDLKDHLVASVADPYGALMRDLQAPVARKNAENLTPFEAVLRHSIYRQRLSAEDHVIARAALERAAEKAPNNADVFASLAAVTIEEIKHDYNWKPDADKRALNAARRAVELDPDNAYAWFELAEVQYFLGDLGAFRSAAERAIELNPRDTEALAMLGILTGYAGDWDRGRELTTRAMALNPNHPGWYRFNVFFDAYRQGNYNEALQIAERIRQPDYFADAYARAIAHAQLGQIQAAERAAQKFISLLPDGFETWREKHLEVWMYAQPALQEQIIEGLEKAGLKIDGGPLEATSAPDQSIAVLPFDALSDDASDDY